MFIRTFFSSWSLGLRKRASLGGALHTWCTGLYVPQLSPDITLPRLPSVADVEGAPPAASVPGVRTARGADCGRTCMFVGEGVEQQQRSAHVVRCYPFLCHVLQSQAPDNQLTACSPRLPFISSLPLPDHKPR